MEEGMRLGLDPSVYTHAAVPSRRSAMSDRPRHELSALMSSDWDVGLACVLATLGIVPQAALHRFLASVSPAAQGTGCDGWLAQIAERYGVSFDSSQLFALSSEKAIYNKIRLRCGGPGTFRSLPFLNGVATESTEYVRGLHAAWCLSPMGASALRALSSREPTPSPREYSFPTSPAGYSTANMIHDGQLATILMSLLVDFARRTQASEGLWDVVDIFGSGEQFGTGGTAMFPDAVIKVLADGEQVTLIVENDSGAMAEGRIQGKATAYLRYMCSGSAIFSWSHPWLVFACPERKVALHERAITSAYEETGLLKRADAGNLGRIAVITHEDIGAQGMSESVYALYSPKQRAFLERRYPISALAWCAERGSSHLGWRHADDAA